MKHRLHSPHLRLTRVPLASLVACLLALTILAGCANPNFIGVQDYGTIYGNVIDSAGKPIGGALVSATGGANPVTSNGNGSFRLPQISVGTQTVSVSAPGFGPPAAPVQVLVVKDVETSVGNITLPSTISAPR